MLDFKKKFRSLPKVIQIIISAVSLASLFLLGFVVVNLPQINPGQEEDQATTSSEITREEVESFDVEPDENEQDTKIPLAELEEEITIDQYQGWLAYESTNLGFSFLYPPYLDVEEREHMNDLDIFYDTSRDDTDILSTVPMHGVVSISYEPRIGYGDKVSCKRGEEIAFIPNFDESRRFVESFNFQYLEETDHYCVETAEGALGYNWYQINSTSVLGEDGPYITLSWFGSEDLGVCREEGGEYDESWDDTIPSCEEEPSQYRSFTLPDYVFNDGLLVIDSIKPFVE